jgi:O-acetylserine/cysteine efflux transporter
MYTQALNLKNLLLILLVVIVWGMNFVFIRLGLNALPPLFLCAVRFGLAAFPLVLFLPRPKAPLKYIFAFGFFNFAMQFGLLFSGMQHGLSPGLASLVAQVQVFFSIGLSFLIFRERPSLWKCLGALISFVGIGIVASHTQGGASLLGLVLTLTGAFCWAVGNIFSKKIDARSALALVAWGSLVAFPVMIVVSLIAEGPALIGASFEKATLTTVGAVFYIVYFSTHVGYGLWGYLLNKYPTAVVAPFTLLIPVVGFLSSAYFFGEELPGWKLEASVFVIAGIAFNLLERQLRGLVGLRGGGARG